MSIVLKDENGRLLTTMFQWDTGRVITFDGADPDAVTEVHYDNDYGYKSQVIIPDVVDDVVKASVPNEILQQDRNFRVYIYQELPFGGKTTSRFTINVFPKLKPENYASNADYKHVLELIGNLETLDTEAKDNLVNAINEAFNHSDIDPEAIAEAVEEYMAEHPFVETDPTVPEWAKEPEKPEYTPQEVGADPAGAAAVAVAAHDADEDAHEELFAQKASAQSVSALTGRVAAIEGKEAGWDAKQDAISDLDEIRQNAEDGAGLAPNVTAIEGKIPSAATSDNKLADKSWVNALIAALTKASVGLGSVENERQYSAQNPPPYPVLSVNNKTGAVVLTPADLGIGNVFTLKGSKNTVSDLPASGNDYGDVWYVIAESVGYIWLNDGTEDRWEMLGLSIDLSAYRPASAQDAIDALLQPKAVTIPHLTATTVEGALQEIGAQLDGLEDALSDINDILEGAL